MQRTYNQHCGKQLEKRSLSTSYRRKEQKLKQTTFLRSFFSSPAHLRNPQVADCALAYPGEGFFIDPLDERRGLVGITHWQGHGLSAELS